MNTKIESININTIPKFSQNEIKMPQSQESIYRMHKYLLGMNRHIDLNISAFDTDQNLTNAESLNSSSKEKLNNSSIPPNHRFSGFRNSMFDISIINSPSKITSFLLYNFNSIFDNCSGKENLLDKITSFLFENDIFSTFIGYLSFIEPKI